MWRRFSRTKPLRAAMACGWSPRGEYSDDSLNTAPTTSGRRRNREEVFSPGIQERVRVRVPEHVRGEHELGMHRLPGESHPDLVGESVALSQVAAQAGRDHVHPARLTAPGARHDVVDGEPLAAPVAVLAGVAVAPQDVLLVERHAVQERLSDVY